MSAIELKAVRKSFGVNEVIHGIDLRVEQGEFCVFVGPSGCGKSTLLRMVAGLEDISAGEVLIDGQVVNDLEASARKLAMVFQSYALYPHMTVAGNMSFGLRMTGTSKVETAQRVAEAAGILQLTELMGRRPAQLSGGQRQRVAIGRAIVRNPGAFLFDEPLSNLDAELRTQMRVEIAKLHSDLKATMIYVTHDQIEAMTLADKIVVLRDGRVEQAGRPSDLYADPDNTFVAGFIGSPRMNLLPAQADRDGQVAFGDAVFRPTIRRPLGEGQKVTLGLRPEGFEPHGDRIVATSLSVDVVENLGGVSIVHARTSRGEPIIVEQRGLQRSRAGETLQVQFLPDEVKVFDESGKRVR
ncbi:MAG: sn-glycerol-3-phosphate ABC transporter ATP-binding protein UgpC [Devosia sp.]|nr:sn-glycerol-3-phosphate ABC transporter ATP-binding protein UgpC [Devosia sp.]